MNTAQDGAGVYLDDSDLTFSHGGHINNNTASGNGGGLYASGSLTSGEIRSYTCDLGQCNQISDNSAAVSGGGVYLADGASFTLVDQLYLDGNQADSSASAAYVTGGALMNITNSMITDGVSPGGVIQVDSTGGASGVGIRGSTLAGNIGATAALLGVTPGASLTIGISIIGGNPAIQLVAGGGTTNITCSILQADYTGLNNLVADPIFMDAPGGDYHIQVISPAVDHCGTGDSYDIDGQARPYYSTTRFNKPYDAGADEVDSSGIFLPFISK